MPTLREFVEQTLAENHLDSNVDQIIKQITDIARERAVNSVAAICDEEVKEMIINNADLANRLAIWRIRKSNCWPKPGSVTGYSTCDTLIRQRSHFMRSSRSNRNVFLC